MYITKIYTFMLILCLSTTVSDAFIRKAYTRFKTHVSRLTHRQCNVVLRNHCTSHKLQNPRMYMVSGSNSIPMQRNIGTNVEAELEFRKTPHTARGAVGVFTYDLVDTKTNRVDMKLAFMFSVPFNFLFHSNWFAAGFFPKSKACDYNLYREMYHNRESTFVRRKAAHVITHKEGKFTVKATMTNTYTPNMSVDVYDVYERVGV